MDTKEVPTNPKASTKFFVLDTNVILHNPEAIFSFADNYVVLPIKVIEELDTFKRNKDELGFNARMAIRTIDHLRKDGHFVDGVNLPTGGMLKIIMPADLKNGERRFPLPEALADNQILHTAWLLRERYPKNSVIFVSKDLNARIKSDALGIAARDFEKQVVDLDTLYQGYQRLILSYDHLRDFFEHHEMPVPEEKRFHANEYILFAGGPTDEDVTGVGRVSGDGKVIKALTAFRDNAGEKGKIWGITPRNLQQQFAMDCLLDPEIELVSLIGGAGTGKTLMALAAGLRQTTDMSRYRKVVVSRPVIPLGRDIGYLPGDKDEKLRYWMQPIYDNLEYLFSRSNGNQGGGTEGEVMYLQERNLLQLEAMTYIRGRSIAKQYLIIDEAQNLTPHEVKTVISRAAEGTKVVLTGDPNQIDNPYLDSRSNGLSYLVDRFKGQSLYAHVALLRSERSKLAGLAAELL